MTRDRAYLCQWDCEKPGPGRRVLKLLRSTCLAIPGAELCRCQDQMVIILARPGPENRISERDCEVNRGDGRLLDREQGSGHQRRVACGNGRGEVGGPERLRSGPVMPRPALLPPLLQDPALCCAARSWLVQAACIVRSN